MTDPDLKLAREIVAARYESNGFTVVAGEIRRAAEKAGHEVPDDLREMAKSVCKLSFDNSELPYEDHVDFITAALTKARAAGVAEERERCAWQPIETAPKDRPILTWCDHEADPYIHPTFDREPTLYAAHAEGFSHAPTGFHIVEWGGSFDDSSYEYSGAWLPDWWFVHGSEFEVAANPILWMDLPPVAAAIRKGGEHE